MKIINEIKKILRKKTCIVGIGNTMRRDDGIGCYIIEELKKNAANGKHIFFNAEDVPENYVFRLAGLDCANILIIDAVHSREFPGSVLFGRIEDFYDMFDECSTHKLPLSMTAEILRRSGKSVFMLGVPVRNIDYGEGLTGNVRTKADMLLDMMIHATESCKEPAYEL